MCWKQLYVFQLLTVIERTANSVGTNIQRTNLEYCQPEHNNIIMNLSEQNYYFC